MRSTGGPSITLHAPRATGDVGDPRAFRQSSAPGKPGDVQLSALELMEKKLFCRQVSIGFSKASVSCKTLKNHNSSFLGYFTTQRMNAEALLLWFVSSTSKPLSVRHPDRLSLATDKIFLHLPSLFCILHLSIKIALWFNIFVSFS